MHNRSGQVGDDVFATGRILADSRSRAVDCIRPTTMALNIREMIGRFIVARIPALDRENMVLVRLHKVEASGIWVENQNFNETMLQKFGMAASATTLVLFVPFSGVEFIVSSLSSIALSETAFGLGE